MILLMDIIITLLNKIVMDKLLIILMNNIVSLINMLLKM
ncbi:Uncharacterised protein [Chlamydia trachomatis]|nr:Uncharacterised protein [Chlamydia trachomatis]